MLKNNDADMSRFWAELLFFGGVAGAVSAPLKLLLHHLFVFMGISQTFYIDLTAYLSHGHYHTKGFLEYMIGEFSDVAIGTICGSIICLFLRYSRPKYHWWMGAGFGFLIWFGSLAFGNLTKLIKSAQTDVGSLTTHLIAMIVFGLLVVLFSRIWPPLRKRVMPDADETVVKFAPVGKS